MSRFVLVLFQSLYTCYSHAHAYWTNRSLFPLSSSPLLLSLSFSTSSTHMLLTPDNSFSCLSIFLTAALISPTPFLSTPFLPSSSPLYSPLFIHLISSYQLTLSHLVFSCPLPLHSILVFSTSASEQDCTPLYSILLHITLHHTYQHIHSPQLNSHQSFIRQCVILPASLPSPPPSSPSVPFLPPSSYPSSLTLTLRIHPYFHPFSHPPPSPLHTLTLTLPLPPLIPPYPLSTPLGAFVKRNSIIRVNYILACMNIFPQILTMKLMKESFVYLPAVSTVRTYVGQVLC